MENLIKILELLNKPLHFFVIGVFLTLWGIWGQHSLDYICFGILLILIACCSFVDKKIKNYQLKKEARIQEKNEEERQKNFREGIVRAYENMPKDDRGIIDECLDNNYPIFKDYYSMNKSAVISLCSQGWGKSSDFYSVFTMNTKHFNILLAYKKEMACKQKRNKRHVKK